MRQHSRTIKARLKKAKHGYVAQCAWPMASGQPCGAPLGYLQAPSEKGISLSYLTSYSRDPRGAPIPHEDWILLPPRSRGQTVARGFSRRSDGDGEVYYTIIKPRPERRDDGSVELDDRGQFVPWRGGRRANPHPEKPRNEGAVLAAILRGEAGHVKPQPTHELLGEKPKLPVEIECGDCDRRSRIDIPFD
jgi:hypothetical protein